MRKSRDFCFTVNNFTKEDFLEIWSFQCKYIVIGSENEGTPHLQGYIYYENPVSVKAHRNKIKKWHSEPRLRQSTPKQASDYCKKDGNFVERGEIPKQGKRTDIDQIRDIIAEGGDVHDLYANARSYQAFRFGQVGLSLYSKRRNTKTHIKWYYGATGTGKSLKAFEEMPEAWASGEVRNGFFFDGYAGEKECIFDDFRPQDMTFAMLLKIFDRYPMRVRILGGSVQFVAEKIIVTTTRHPREFYAEREDVNQLLRRIEIVERFGTEVRGNTRIPDLSDYYKEVGSEATLSVPAIEHTRRTFLTGSAD